MLELIFMTDLLLEYSFRFHISSDIGLDQRVVASSSNKIQTFQGGIALSTEQNKTQPN